MRKSVRRWALVLLVTFAAVGLYAGGAGEGGAEKPVVLRAMSFSTESDKSVAPGYYALIEAINEKAKGRLVIEHRGASEAIPGFDQFEALSSGVFDLGVENESYYGKQLTGLPLTHLSRLSPVEERKTEYPALRDQILNKHNVKYLGRAWGWGMGYRVYTNVLVKDPKKDFKGQRIRISPAYQPLALAVGATPVVIPFPDIYTAMERNTMDGFIIACSMALEYSWQQVVKYFTDPAVYNINLEILMNLDTWNKLPADLQKVIQEAVIEFEKASMAESLAYVKDYRQRMIDAGMTPLEWSKADSEWFQNTAYEAAWKDLESTMADKEMFRRLKEVLD